MKRIVPYISISLKHSKVAELKSIFYTIVRCVIRIIDIVLINKYSSTYRYLLADLAYIIAATTIDTNGIAK